MTTLAVVILAAGQGTRMLSKKQKILHEVGGRPMVAHVFEAAIAVSDLVPVVVVGPGETGVRSLLGDGARYVEQAHQLGTGHATLMAKPILDNQSDQVLVTYGDMPLLRLETMVKLARLQAEKGATIALLTMSGESSSTFGRISRDESGHVVEIIEVAEARLQTEAEELLAIRELNAGVYCFEAGWLWDHLSALPARQARRGTEYYLTDMIGLAVSQGRQVVSLESEDANECLGAGTRAELVTVERAFRKRANQKWLEAGVTLVEPDSVYIDQTVTIGSDTIIWPGTYLIGQTSIGEDCVLGPNCTIRDSQIGFGCRIEQAVVENSVLGDGTKVKPFMHIDGQH